MFALEDTGKDINVMTALLYLAIEIRDVDLLEKAIKLGVSHLSILLHPKGIHLLIRGYLFS